MAITSPLENPQDITQTKNTQIHTHTITEIPTFYLIQLYIIQEASNMTSGGSEKCHTDLATEASNRLHRFNFVVTQLDKRINSRTSKRTKRRRHQIYPDMFVVSCCNGWT